VLRLPLPDEGKAGKIVRDGNRINKAITYELGTPIPQGKDKGPIAELEFLAPTYGDIEDILAADCPPGPMSALGGSGRAVPKEEVRV
jgi:hypothetical protein